MGGIRYVCLSDMHFGEEDSLLTRLRGEEEYHATGALPPKDDPVDVSEPSPVLSKLVECMGRVISECGGPKKPILVLNGDILELALATTDEAAMAFERFVDLAFRRNGGALFEHEVRYVPGNHDHHLWEVARETLFVEYVKTPKRQDDIPIPWHVSSIFKEPVPSYFLDGVIAGREGLEDVEFLTSYPNCHRSGESAPLRVGSKCSTSF